MKKTKVAKSNAGDNSSHFGAGQAYHSQSALSQPNQVIIIQKGNFFGELERLKCLDNHRQRLDKITGKDPKTAVRASVDRNDPQKAEIEKRRRQDFDSNRK
jgi:hypothetical protein